MLRNLLFLLAAKRAAGKRAAALLPRAGENPQFSQRGMHRARMEFDLGLLYQATGRSGLAREHLRAAHDDAGAEQAPALIAKINAALAEVG